jgi:hypothetical protein
MAEAPSLLIGFDDFVVKSVMGGDLRLETLVADLVEVMLWLADRFWLLGR